MSVELGEVRNLLMDILRVKQWPTGGGLLYTIKVVYVHIYVYMCVSPYCPPVCLSVYLYMSVRPSNREPFYPPICLPGPSACPLVCLLTRLPVRPLIYDCLLSACLSISVFITFNLTRDATTNTSKCSS